MNEEHNLYGGEVDESRAIVALNGKGRGGPRQKGEGKDGMSATGKPIREKKK